MISSNYFINNVAQKEALKDIEISNPNLNIGLEYETMGSMPQVPFLVHVRQETIKTPVPSSTDIGSVQIEKGAEVIPASKDFYLGSPL